MDFRVRKHEPSTSARPRRRRATFNILDLAKQFFRDELPLWLTVPIVLSLLFLITLLLSLARRPSAEHTKFSLFSGYKTVGRAMVTEKHPDRVDPLTGMRGRFTRLIPFLPHHLTFSSTKEPVDIYVVEQSMDDGSLRVEQMLTLTEQLENGIPPQRIFAHAHGMQGTIPLYDWPWGRTHLLILIHASDGETVVKTETHYAP